MIVIITRTPSAWWRSSWWWWVIDSDVLWSKKVKRTETDGKRHSHSSRTSGFWNPYSNSTTVKEWNESNTVPPWCVHLAVWQQQFFPASHSHVCVVPAAWVQHEHLPLQQPQQLHSPGQLPHPQGILILRILKSMGKVSCAVSSSVSIHSMCQLNFPLSSVFFFSCPIFVEKPLHSWRFSTLSSLRTSIW